MLTIRELQYIALDVKKQKTRILTGRNAVFWTSSDYLKHNIGGNGEIRTHGTPSCTLDFEYCVQYQEQR
jgi:hypothetical protein